MLQIEYCDQSNLMIITVLTIISCSWYYDTKNFCFSIDYCDTQYHDFTIIL